MTTTTAWDEPVGATPRGTLILLPGRGETPTSYQRFGKRLSADAYKVRLVPLDLADLAIARTQVEKLLADESLPGPKVLVGTDVGATLVGQLLDEVAADAAIIAGVALPDSQGVDGWDAEVDARSACPLHRKLIAEDAGFGRGSLNGPFPAEWDELERTVPGKPVLILHGDADPITALDKAIEPYVGHSVARVKIVKGGRHDLLNDIMHRSVAATIVLFLESLRLGADLPDAITSA